MLLKKELGASARELWAQCARDGDFETANKKQGWRFWLKRRRAVGGIEFVNARLEGGRFQVVGLDFHLRPSRDPHDGAVIAPGYHWDLFWPAKQKLWIAVQPTSPDEALALLVNMWNIVLDVDLQENLFR